MRGSKHDMAATFETSGVVMREAEWGDINVGLEASPTAAESAPLFTGLLDDCCQCPHWGYVLEGRFRALYRSDTP